MIRAYLRTGTAVGLVIAGLIGSHLYLASSLPGAASARFVYNVNIAPKKGTLWQFLDEFAAIVALSIVITRSVSNESWSTATLTRIVIASVVGAAMAEAVIPLYALLDLCPPPSWPKRPDEVRRFLVIGFIFKVIAVTVVSTMGWVGSMDGGDAGGEESRGTKEGES